MEEHKEDWYFVTGEVMNEVEFLQDLADDGLFQRPTSYLPKNYLETNTPEREGKPKPFGYGTTAEGPDLVNL